LDRRRISATVLLIEKDGQVQANQNDVRKLVFERLNTGGRHLNAQELRNCLYEGPLNDLLIQLSKDALFTKIWEIPIHSRNTDKQGNISKELRENTRYRRMEDCSIVLRFFAFREKSNIKGSVRSMLDRYMEKNKDIPQDEASQLEKDFLSRLKLANAIFGAKAFRFEDEDGNWTLSLPLYDGVMVALDRLWKKKDTLVAERSKVVRDVVRLFHEPTAYEVLVGRPNTARAVQQRMDILMKAIER
jgi:hypothetical protein